MTSERCQACGTVPDAQAMFCANCGAALRVPAVSAPSTDTRLSVQLPPTAVPVPPRPGETPAVALGAPVTSSAPAAGGGARRPLPSGNKLLFGILGAVVVGTLVVASVGISSAMNQPRTESVSVTDGAAPVTDEDALDAVTTPTPDPSPTTDGVLAVPIPTTEFRSESNNIRCRISDAGVLCLQQYIKYAPPATNCPSSFAAAAAAVDETDVSFPCISSDIKPTVVLAYDTPLVVGPYSCTINLASGITCVNSAGVGFRMENETGIVRVS